MSRLYTSSFGMILAQGIPVVGLFWSIQVNEFRVNVKAGRVRTGAGVWGIHSFHILDHDSIEDPLQEYS